MDEQQAYKNTDVEIWRGKSRAESSASDPDRFYADSLFVTAGDVEALGINCGGYVIVKPIREWFRLANFDPNRTSDALEPLQELAREMKQDAANAAYWRGKDALEHYYPRIESLLPALSAAIDALKEHERLAVAAVLREASGRYYETVAASFEKWLETAITTDQKALDALKAETIEQAYEKALMQDTLEDIRMFLKMEVTRLRDEREGRAHQRGSK